MNVNSNDPLVVDRENGKIPLAVYRSVWSRIGAVTHQVSRRHLAVL